jgi:aspartyl/asparaginyl-tRNA synthetase
VGGGGGERVERYLVDDDARRAVVDGWVFRSNAKDNVTFMDVRDGVPEVGGNEGVVVVVVVVAGVGVKEGV